MRERPILFSAPMVRAILEGRKTQTRRVCKGQRELSNIHDFRLDSCPYGQPGDRLWVRETWAIRMYSSVPPQEGCGDWHAYYEADAAHQFKAEAGKVKIGSGPLGRLRPSIHMPRWASRLLLEVTEVRVERLQAITETDAIAEGVKPGSGIRGDDDIMVPMIMSAHDMRHLDRPMMPAPVARFVLLWDSINRKQLGVTNWNANPWVWVVGFKRVTP